MCEEFHVLPTEALEAIENDVGGLLRKILDIRSYRQARENYETTPKEKRIFKKGSLEDLVDEFTFALAKEKIQRAKDQQ